MFTAAPIAMDLRTAVYNAARDGKLKLLQKLLGSRSREELEALTAGPGGGDGPGGGGCTCCPRDGVLGPEIGRAHV